MIKSVVLLIPNPYVNNIDRRECIVLSWIKPRAEYRETQYSVYKSVFMVCGFPMLERVWMISVDNDSNLERN